MKNRIYFFTGTGNSFSVAQKIAEALPDCELVAICKNTSLEIPSNYDRIGFVFPNYSGGPPKMVAKFIRKMKVPAQEKTYLFAVSTYGGNRGGVIAQIGEQLKQRNWKLNYGTTIWSYPNAITLYPMIKGVGFFTKRTAYRSKKVIKEINAKKQKSVPKLKKMSSKMYDNFMRQIYASDKGYNTNENCISCGICTKICPAKNITLINGKPVFHHQCESCQGCIQYCPKEAINYENKTQKRKRYTHPEVKMQSIIRYYNDKKVKGEVKRK